MRIIAKVTLLATMAVIGWGIGYGADRLNRKYTGRALYRALTNAKCTPCEQAAIDRLKAEKEAKK